MNEHFDPTRLSRRDLLRIAGLGAGALGASALLAACGGKSPGKQAGTAGSIAALQAGAQEVSVLGSNTPRGTANEPYGFVLSNASNQLLTGGTAQVWIALDRNAKATGPFPAPWREMRAYTKAKDQLGGLPPTTGFYAAEIAFPSPGNWMVAAVAGAPGKTAVGIAAVPVVGQGAPAQLGTKAISVRTPVATDKAGLAKICTRHPPDPMHYISLDAALRNGKPTVISFATPLLCQSRLCGPVVDEQLAVFNGVGRGKANFIHVEEYLQPNPKQTNATDIAPAFQAWKFETEPWVLVIDRTGVIRFRNEGPVVADMIQAALTPLL